ncbi:probable polygalacturonase At1g80170 [Syzygium oleosum]|uniref:probable polygalacturonase At1g80170 n=1 Tax=Syzygium oleosum TaxID=219896 RepID=UPI0024BB6067|nr:probable polygalacturonase At1g80170 [Syzygium oleosum]
MATLAALPAAMARILLCLFVLARVCASIGSRLPIDDGKKFFDVIEYGTVGDGRTDNTKAFKKAWNDACESKASVPTMHIPQNKTYLLQPLVLRGPCNSQNLTIQIDGTLAAPGDPSAWKKRDKKSCRHWIMIGDVDGLSVLGSGAIDGNGSGWWDHSLCRHRHVGCGKKPTGLVIDKCNEVRLSDLTFKDSPQMHIAIERSTRVRAANLTITSPGHSPNTDGIHVQRSRHVRIHDCRIGTGDDCISIGNGSAHLDISRITCGPGHGISIGSLGKHGSRETVEDVRVRDVHFVGTSNGVRIKTWQGRKGYARDIVFERITVSNSSHPIIIDQFYCDHQDCKNQTSAVEISNVTYSQVNGTSRAKAAVEFACSNKHSCRDILMKDITLNLTAKGKETTSYCSNVRGRRNSNIFPSISCLEEDEDL